MSVKHRVSSAAAARASQRHQGERVGHEKGKDWGTCGVSEGKCRAWPRAGTRGTGGFLPLGWGGEEEDGGWRMRRVEDEQSSCCAQELREQEPLCWEPFVQGQAGVSQARGFCFSCALISRRHGPKPTSQCLEHLSWKVGKDRTWSAPGWGSSSPFSLSSPLSSPLPSLPSPLCPLFLSPLSPLSPLIPA